MAHDVALYFAAKAALKLDAEASLEEAVQLLQQVIEGKGSLANEARLELAPAGAELRLRYPPVRAAQRCQVSKPSWPRQRKGSGRTLCRGW